MFNCDKTIPPFNNSYVRKALGLSIDREQLLTDLEIAGLEMANKNPANSFIPDKLLEGGWADGADTISYNVTEADSITAGITPFNCNVLYNYLIDSTLHATIFDKIQIYFKVLDVVDIVSYTAKEWSIYLDDRANGNFEIARGGWSLDSNNILEYLKIFCGEGNQLNYSNTVVDSLITEARSALDNNDLSGYEQALISINNILIEEMPAIPIYNY